MNKSYIVILILSIIGMYGERIIPHHPNLVAYSLLFAMGLQNSLVTRISNAEVRTTHLTGLFTDLGFELSQLFFFKSDEQQKKLFSSINLRLRIIIFFFTGGFVAGVFYSRLRADSRAMHSIFAFSFFISCLMKLNILMYRFATHTKENPAIM